MRKLKLNVKTEGNKGGRALKLGVKALIISAVSLISIVALCVGVYFSVRGTGSRNPVKEAVALSAPSVGESTNATPAHTHDGEWEVLSSHTDTKNALVIGAAGEHKKYYLTQDVTLSKQIEVAANSEVTLCLNGYVIKYTGGKYESVIGLNKGVTLNLCDCNSENRTNKYSVSDTGVWTVGSGSKSFSGGAITSSGAVRGGICSYTGVASSAAPMYNANVTVNMYGGTLTGIMSNSYASTIALRGANNMLNMYGGLIAGNNGNTSAPNGEAVSVRGTSASRSSFEMYSGVLAQAHTDAWSVVDVNYADFTMHDGSISDNKSKCAVHVKNGGFVMEDGYICDNVNASSGHLIYTQEKGYFDISGGSISNNNKSAYNIFYADSAGVSNSISNVELLGNTANLLFYSSSTAAASTYVFESCTIENNTCTNDYGMLRFLSTGKISFNNCQINNNVAKAGAITLDNTSNEQLKITNTHITSDAKHNSTRGLYLLKGKELIVEDCVISGMVTAGAGGGIYSNVAKSTITRTNVTGNTAGTTGGGVWFGSAATTATVSGGSVSGNKAATDGGGIYVTNAAAVFTVENTLIENNVAEAGAGGGVYSKGVTDSFNDVTVTGNTAFGLGGGIYVNNSSSTTELTRSHISGNKGSHGGGIYVYGQKFTLSGGEDSETRTKIADNTATTHGGGIYLRISGAILIERADIYGNTANEAGGGINLQRAGSNLCTISSCTVTENTVTQTPAGTWGGGAGISQYDDSGSSATWCPINISDSVITYNKALKAYRGGGISARGALTVTNTTVDYNEVGTGLTDATVRKNITGGGISSNGELTITGSSVSDNKSGGTGGGVYANVASHITDCNIDRNFAVDGGAGLFAKGGSTVTRGSVSENTAELKVAPVDNWGGGGILCNGVLVVDGTAVNSNKVLYKGTTNEYIAGTGGGIMSYGNSSSLEINNAEVNGNTAQGSKINYGGCGGGIFARTLKMTGCTVSGNSVSSKFALADAGTTAMCAGGGIYVYYFVSTITDSDISGNTAAYGGGIGQYMYSGDYKSVITNSTVNGNTATEIGGGIYLSKINSSRYLTLDGTAVTNNLAKEYAGVYLHNESESGSGHYLKVAGAAKISGNKIYATVNGNTVIKGISNLRIVQARPIEITGKLTEGAQIWFTLDTVTGPIATNYKAYNGSEDPSEYFYSEDDRCSAEISPDDDTKVVSAISYKAMAEGHTSGSDHGDFTPLTSQILTDSSYTPVKANGSGMYYLTGDLTISQTINVTNSKSAMILCLNGYKLTAVNCNAFNVDKSSALYILDCCPTRAHSYAVRSDGSWNFSSSGKTHRGGVITLKDTDVNNDYGAFGVRTNSKLFVYGATVSGFTGYGVYSNSSEVNLKGTRFVGNVLSSYVLRAYTNSKATLTDVTVDQNKAGSYIINAEAGSAVSLKNAKIKSNVSTSYAFLVNASTVDLTDSEISGNEFNAYYGFNLTGTGAELNLSSTKINGNKFVRSIIYIASPAKLNMPSGEICGNVSTLATSSAYGVVYIASVTNGTATFNMSGGKIADNKMSLTRAGGGIYVAGTRAYLNLSGGAVVSGNRNHVSKTLPDGDEMNVCLATNQVRAKIVGAMEAGARVGLTIWGVNEKNKPSAVKGFLTSGYSKYNASVDPLTYFYSDTLKFDITLRDGELTTVDKIEVTLDLQYTYTETDDDGNTEEIAAQRAAYTYTNEKLAKPDDPLREGFAFTGWFTDPECTEAYDFDTRVTEDFTLYAGWKTAEFTVSFYTGGGTSVADRTVAYNGTVTAPATAPRRSGYKFDGWFADEEHKTVFDFSTKITENTIIYAGWVRQYAVVFNTDGGTAVEKQLLLAGGKITKPADPKKRNYVFLGWYADAEKTQAFDFTADVTGDLTVYAGWEFRCEHLGMKKIAEVKPTCVTAGNVEYYHCEECGKYFAAADGSGEAAKETFAALPTGKHLPVTDPAVSATCVKDGKTEGSHCKVCGLVIVEQQAIPASGHTPGDEATCTQSQKCTVCNAVITPALGHDYSTEWSTDNASHWHACTRCSTAAKKDSASHDFEWIIDSPADIGVAGQKHRHCAVCGYDTDRTEIPARVCTHDEFTHHERMEPTCTTDGSIEYWHCETCNEYFSDGDLSKKIADASTYNDEMFRLAALGHDFADTITQPTCETDGEIRHACTRCGEFTSEIIEKLGHDLQTHGAKAHTCTEAGWNEYVTCSRCDYTTYEEIEASGHSFIEDSWISNGDAACEKDGTKTRYCTNGCGFAETVTEEGSATGHSYPDEYTVDVQPTCTHEGSKSKHCVHCGNQTDVQTMEMLPHLSTSPATCTEDEICVNCNAVISKATGHAPDEEWNESETEHWHVCGNCGEIIDCGAHDMTVVVVKPATYEEEGLGYEECSVCGRPGRESVVIERLSCLHESAHKVEAKEATCSTAGNIAHWYCDGCNKYFADEACTEELRQRDVFIDVKAHVWENEYRVDIEPDCENEGVESIHCANCSETKNERAVAATGHNFETVTEWTSDGEKHWHLCANGCGAKQDEAEHDFEIIIDIEPTLDTEGEQHGKCRVCGYESERVTVPPLICQHTDKTKTEAVAPTCVAAGNPEYWYCNTCGKYFLDEDCTELAGTTPPVTAIDPEAHNWDDEWTSGEGKHWHACKNGCGERQDEADHIAGDGATCTTAQECTVCHEVLVAALGHEWSEEWTTDETHHWHVCTRCNDENIKGGEAEHTAGSAPTCTEAQTCTECGYELAPATGHDFATGDDWTSDGEKHWHACKNSCGERQDEADHIAGDGATCTTAQECTVCHEVLVAALGHEWSEEWVSDDDYHWHVCTRCNAETEKDDNAKHSADGQPTCEDDVKCVCGKVLAPATGHDFATGDEWTSDGEKHWHACKNGCGKRQDEADHIAGDGATCTTPQECTICHKELVAALGHEWSEEWTTDETHHWHKCTRCNDESVKGDEAEHSFEWHTDKEPTYEEVGKKHEECSVCKLKRNEDTDIPVLEKHENKITDFEMPKTVVYGEEYDPVADSTYGEVEFTYYEKVGDEYTAIEGKPRDAGVYRVKASVAEGYDYKGAEEIKDFEILRREITVAIEPASSIKDDPLEQLSAKVTQGTLVEGDDLPYELETDANPAEVGKYAITLKVLNDNYDITWKQGVYVVAKRAVDLEGGGEIDMPFDDGENNFRFSISQSETKNQYPEVEDGVTNCIKRGYWAQLWKNDTEEYTGKLTDKDGNEVTSIVTLTVPKEIIDAIRDGGPLNMEEITENLGVYYVSEYADEERKSPSKLERITNFKLRREGDEFKVKFEYDGEFGAEIVFGALNAREPEPASEKAATPWWVWVIVGVGAALVAGTVITIIIVAKRKKGPSGGGGGKGNEEIIDKLNSQGKKIDELIEMTDGGFNDSMDE